MSNTILRIFIGAALVSAGSAHAQQSGKGTAPNAPAANRPSGESPPAAHSTADEAIYVRGAEIDGTVVRATSDTVWVQDKSGAVIPLKVDSKTRFSDTKVTRAQDLKEGQPIRASFMIVDKTVNLAMNISTGHSKHGRSSDSRSGWYGSKGSQRDSTDQPPMHGQGTIDDKGFTRDSTGYGGSDMAPPGSKSGASGAQDKAKDQGSK